jgi:transposase-like protein
MTMNQKKRQHFSPDEKVRILRRHLLDKVPVSDLCDEFGIRPTVFYRWQKEFFEQGAAAFERIDGRNEKRLERTIERLESKLAHKDQVISEIMEEHVALKKSLGEE